MAAARRGLRTRAAIAAGAALPLLLLAPAGCAAIRTAGILEDALRPASALRDEVEESEARVPFGDADLRLRISRARGSTGPLPAVLVVHGAAEGGADDPRMEALWRSLAAHGATAAALDLPTLRRFELDPRDPDRVAAAAAWLAGRADLAEDGRTALLGVSVGGSYAILAAADPSIRDRVSAVFAFGAYADLGGLLEIWLVGPGRAVPGLFDPVREGRRLVFLGNLDRLVPPADHAAAASVLRALLDGTPPPAPEGPLADRTRALLDAAISEEPIPQEAARALLEPLAADIEALSPSRARTAPAAPVWLLHAEGDPVVPASDGETLRAALRARGADAVLHVTDLFGHVDPAGGEPPSFLDALPLVWFLSGFVGEAGL